MLLRPAMLSVVLCSAGLGNGQYRAVPCRAVLSSSVPCGPGLCCEVNCFSCNAVLAGHAVMCCAVQYCVQGRIHGLGHGGRGPSLSGKIYYYIIIK